MSCPDRDISAMYEETLLDNLKLYPILASEAMSRRIKSQFIPLRGIHA